ncbi:MAG: 3-hydroxyacyl-CoA dehydrogenase NAD-binding domain-containing protein [Verrucomicrobia bacterium]|nr:3-hydroxyacyl-CoA dehydrogenase NAD-binding domain-containing protein [Verrucomicrobiota bacterium]MDA1085891.1 3-hydroxyacyl-CoA dehydrogenase NAD-binding domain-containing protein [Verrucomicrobiota bacterium]
MSSAWTFQEESSGLGHLTFDTPEMKVNVFTAEAVAELSDLLEDLAKRNLKALAISSGKSSFIAGADIKLLRTVTTTADGIEKARLGQNVFDKLAALPYPTIVFIHGACMGGGLELALACDYRVVSDHAKTILGLPEVQLGFIPGWGGTQRLPRLIGLEASLSMILTGKPVAAKKALKIGLAHVMVATEFMQAEMERLSQDLAEGRPPRLSRRPPGLVARLRKAVLESTPPGRHLLIGQARKRLLEKTKGLYPAPLAALDVLEATATGDIQAGLQMEAEAFGRLIVTTESRNMVRLFFIREALKKESGVETDVEEKHVQRAAVVGAGVMGGGIAWLMSHCGIPVRLKDIDWDAVTKGMATAASYYQQLVRIRKMVPDEVALKMHHISGTTDYRGVESADLVLEAVVEKMAVKQAVLAEVENVVSPHALIGTNTSSLSITEMATALKHPERFAGMHFFNPVNRMPLVEVIPGAKTAPATIASFVAFARRVGKTPVVVGDCPGFLVNRILLPYINECIWMLQEGIAAERIDRLLFDFGMPMGPIRLADEVGLDVGAKVTDVLEAGYGERMQVAPLLKRLAAEPDTTGKKAGRGFYVYEGRKKSVNPRVDALRLELAREHALSARELDDQTILRRAIYIMINEAARCLAESVVEKPDYLDMAMLMGTGFPAHHGGLLAYADTAGIPGVVETLRRFAEEFGPRFAPCERLEEMAAAKTLFYKKNGGTDNDG